MYGSTWHKWDLHVHTPSSFCTNYGDPSKAETWERYINDLENLDPSFKVLGINDYFLIDGYIKLKEAKENGRLKNIDRLLPVIELRTSDFIGVDFKWGRLNYHIIFSDELDIRIITREFQNKLNLRYIESGFVQSLSHESLEELGKHIINKTLDNKKVGGDWDNPLIVGFNNAHIDRDEIDKALSNPIFSGKYITGIGIAEWKDIKWSNSSIAAKKDMFFCSDIQFVAAENPESYQQSLMKLEKEGISGVILLDCSDAHDYSSNTKNKDRIGNCNTWIKAETTFEGLKQILYESETRLKISTDKPIEPVKKIQQVNLSFPDDTSIKGVPFCLRGHRDPIYFSPYFTCIIGGRGTGKSTLLNLIAKSIGEETEFFRSMEFNHNIDANVTVIGTAETEAKFFGQNQILEMINSDKFNSYIYSLIDKEVENFSILKDELRSLLDRIQENIELYCDIEKLECQKNELQTEINRSDQIIKSVQDEEYLRLQSSFFSLQTKIKEYTDSKERHQKLLTDICKLVENYSIEEVKNTYDEAVSELINSINKIIEEHTKKYQNSFINCDNHNNSSKDEIIEIKKRINDFLKIRNLNEEDIRDIDLARDYIEENKSILVELERQISEKEDAIFRDMDEVKAKSEEVLSAIIKNLNDINNDKLKINNQSVQEIRLEYKYDIEKVLVEISEFIEHICRETNPKTGIHFSSVRNKLLDISEEVFKELARDKEKFYLWLCDDVGQRTSEYLIETLNMGRNKDKIFDYIKYCLYDVLSFRSIRIFMEIQLLITLLLVKNVLLFLFY